MLAVMSKKKPGRPKSSLPTKDKILAMRLAPDLEESLTAYIAAQKFPPDRTAVGTRALIDFLRSEGFYPPPPRKP